MVRSWVVLVLAWALVGCGGKPAPRSPGGGGGGDAETADKGAEPALAHSEGGDEEDPETMPMAAAVPTADGAAVTCDRPDPMGPARVSQEAYDKRHGAGARRFSEVPSEKSKPLEACGIRASLEVLSTLTCDDGKSPFGGDGRKAHASRRGSMGSGGRCGSIIDAYDVPCPEATYTVYMDMYLCGPDTVWK